MRILNKKYQEIIAFVKTFNVKKETIDLLYELTKFNRNKILTNIYMIFIFN